MRVSKQKGRHPYHGLFCPDYLFLHPSKAEQLIQRASPHLGTFVFGVQPRWDSDKKQREKTIPELDLQW